MGSSLADEGLEVQRVELVQGTVIWLPGKAARPLWPSGPALTTAVPEAPDRPAWLGRGSRGPHCGASGPLRKGGRSQSRPRLREVPAPSPGQQGVAMAAAGLRVRAEDWPPLQAVFRGDLSHLLDLMGSGKESLIFMKKRTRRLTAQWALAAQRLARKLGGTQRDQKQVPDPLSVFRG